MLETCLQCQVPPCGMNCGDSTNKGVFLRNLKNEHVALRYQMDDPAAPDFGRKLSPRFWKDQAKQGGDLSVNEKSCVSSDQCSIAIQLDSHRYHHIAEINLERLNAFCPEGSFVAVYRPESVKISDDMTVINKCHFEIMGTDSVVIAQQILSEVLGSAFPKCKQIPTSPSEKESARNAFLQYRSIVDIRCSIGGHQEIRE